MLQDELDDGIVEEVPLFRVVNSGNPEFDRLLHEISELHRRKNSDYANPKATGSCLANFFECEGFGIPAWKGILVRMGDKWSRIKSLAYKGSAEVKDETVEDTLIDLAVYSLLCVLVRRQPTNARLGVERSVGDETTDAGEADGPVDAGTGDDGTGV